MCVKRRCHLPLALRPPNCLVCFITMTYFLLVTGMIGGRQQAKRRGGCRHGWVCHCALRKCAPLTPIKAPECTFASSPILVSPLRASVRALASPMGFRRVAGGVLATSIRCPAKPSDTLLNREQVNDMAFHIALSRIITFPDLLVGRRCTRAPSPYASVRQLPESKQASELRCMSKVGVMKASCRWPQAQDRRPVWRPASAIYHRSTPPPFSVHLSLIHI